MSDFVLTTPVALLVFNRPELTAQVFAAIREARPPRLLVVADGPRPGRQDDLVKCAEVRRIVEQVDWSCEVLQNYSLENMGCRMRVSSGLDWVFGQVEEAIILEDDCLPEASFFRFCQELLEYYRDDKRIGMVSGDNFQGGVRYTGDSYYFSKYYHVWGWATWKNRWTGYYDADMKKWPAVRNSSWLSNVLGTKSESLAWKKKFEKVFSGKIDTWDYQWVFTNWLQGRLCILPSLNLISNIGFTADATHTKVSNSLDNIERYVMPFPLKHPQIVTINTIADRKSQHVSTGSSFFRFVSEYFRGFMM